MFPNPEGRLTKSVDAGSARSGRLLPEDEAPLARARSVAKPVQGLSVCFSRSPTRKRQLVEAGFATNRSDGAFLASATGQHKIAAAIADAIVGYLLEFERKLAGVGGGSGQAR